MGQSLLYYPLIGLLVGIFLASISLLLSGIPSSVHAAIILCAWVALTGGLHLDGLADSADAWVGGLGDRDKTLTIMKDPHCGPAAVITLLLILLLKFIALEYLITTGYWQMLILAPLLGRSTLVLLFLTTPYVRNNGLGKQIATHIPRQACYTLILCIAIAIPVFINLSTVGLLMSLAATFFLLRVFMLQRIDGMTGDTAGAMLEISEAIVLLTAVLIQ